MISKPSHIEYFRFEEDFVEDNLRCIPMIVRMKLDTIGIKLTLRAWSRLREKERNQLAVEPCKSEADILKYKKVVLDFAKNHSIEDLGNLNTGENAGWKNPGRIPGPLIEKLNNFNQRISISQWRSLTELQRFAMVKLSRPGHESKNFIKALEEFGLFNKSL
jgi:hypothetical protein